MAMPTKEAPKGGGSAKGGNLIGRPTPTIKSPAKDYGHLPSGRNVSSESGKK